VKRHRTRVAVGLGAVLVAASATLAVDACGGDSGDDTPAEVLAKGGSIARVTVGAQVFDFVVTCHDAGAGSVLAVGTGTQVDGDGRRHDTHLLVQAFLGDSYVGVTVDPIGDAAHDGDEAAPPEIYEASLADVFDLALEDDVIAADGIEFVRDLDLGAGQGEPAGSGSLRVTCGSYQPVPPGLDR
jgi:hypothetical protein